MTHHPIRTLPDGTRVYSNGTRYKPKAAADRVYAVRKPDSPSAVRWRGEWLEPLPVLPEAARGPLPATRADSEAYDHMPRPCRCEVCQRPAAARWQRKWRRDRGLRA